MQKAESFLRVRSGHFKRSYKNKVIRSSETNVNCIQELFEVLRISSSKDKQTFYFTNKMRYSSVSGAV